MAKENTPQHSNTQYSVKEKKETQKTTLKQHLTSSESSRPSLVLTGAFNINTGHSYFSEQKTLAGSSSDLPSTVDFEGFLHLKVRNSHFIFLL